MSQDPSVAEALVANLPIAVYRTTPDGRIAYANDALAVLLGAPSGLSLESVDVRELYEDPSARTRMQTRVADGEAASDDEVALRTLDGRILWTRVRSRAVYDARGEVVAYEGVIEDISTARRTTADLVKSHSTLDALTRIQNLFIAGSDPGRLFDDLLEELLAMSDSEYGFIARLLENDDGPFLRSLAMTNIAWNDEIRAMYEELGPRRMEFHNLENLFGYAVLRGEPVISGDPKNDPRRGSAPYGHPPLNAFLGLPIFKGEAVVGMIALANRPGGYDEEIAEELAPLAATVGSMIEALGADEARRLAEARERSQEELYRAVVDHAAEAVITFVDDDLIEAANPAAVQMTGFDEAELIGRHRAELFVDASGVPAELRPGPPADMFVVRADGQRIPVEVSVGTTSVNERAITITVARDMAARKAIEDALRDAKESAERTSTAKDLFLAGMSHELRTPLNAIIGLSTLLGREIHGPINDKQREYLTQVEGAGRHLLELINDVLDLAKIDADKLEPEIEQVNLTEVIESAIAVVREAALSRGVSLDGGSAFGPLMVRADRRRAKQVLLNLLSNAVKFTEPGGSAGITVSTDDTSVIIEVWDTGVGIAPEHLAIVFEPFEQIDQPGSTRHGTGLGLALSRRLAEAQGGSLTATSDVGVGSRFVFTLPLAVPAPAESVEESPGVDAPQRAGDGITVLVVEDNAVNRMLITDYLELFGFDIVVATDGVEAVDQARSLRPDAILMDVQIPRKDGLAATRELKADEATAGIPIVALTALAMKGDEERCLEAGCDAYLSKPCDPTDVMDLVLELVR